MWRRFILLGLISVGASLAAEPAAVVVDGPKARFSDDLVSRLEGSWNLTRKIRGTEVHNRVTASWVLNHQFLQIHMRDVAEPPAYEAIVFVGYIHATGTYVAHWIDCFGGRFSAIGTGKRTGNSIEFRFDYPDGPFFNTFTWSPDSGQWTFRGESQDEHGARRLFAFDTLVRQP